MNEHSVHNWSQQHNFTALITKKEVYTKKHKVLPIANEYCVSLRKLNQCFWFKPMSDIWKAKIV